MGLRDYVPGSFEKTEGELRDFISDETRLPVIRAELARKDLSADERTGLEGWLKFFESNLIENPEAKRLVKKIIELEGALERSRRSMKLGYTDPASGKFVESDSMGLTLLIRTSADEAVRKAAHQGLKAIETHVLANGFIEIVKERNRLGRMLGYEDYYDFKVSRNEGMSKRTLFGLLDELERETRGAGKRALDALKAEKGPSADQAHNYGFFTSGSLTRQLDPFFRFQSALGRWGRSFMNLGIRYRGSELKLDLLSRKGKYENGFMHAPFAPYVDLEAGGKFRPARINFTSLGSPGQIGSGYTELNTLFHEGGHAAHFSNIRMPAPCFSQEFAPTSVAFAETQSMFCDSLVEDTDWRTRYAKNVAGEPMPTALLREAVETRHKYLANTIRMMLGVPYVERGIYEMPEERLTPENILALVRQAASTDRRP
jgi:Zn-dependent oligopeptidase